MLSSRPRDGLVSPFIGTANLGTEHPAARTNPDFDDTPRDFDGRIRHVERTVIALAGSHFAVF